MPVAELIRERVAVSLPLALLAIALSAAIAIPLGVLAAARRNRPTDLLVSGLAQVGVAIPNFWFAILLILLFRRRPALAAGRRLSPAGTPASAGAAVAAAADRRAGPAPGGDPDPGDPSRHARGAGGGLPPHRPGQGPQPRRRLWRHALPNAMIPVVTIMGLQFSFLLAGTVIIENVFYPARASAGCCSRPSPSAT